MKIIIIEDEEILYLVLEEKFKSAGYEVMIVTDGDQARSKVKEFEPDIVLLDLVLPKKGGLSVLSDLKNDPETKNIPVIVLSNLDGDETIEKAVSSGAVGYFIKTQYPIDSVVDKVGLIIKNQKK